MNNLFSQLPTTVLPEVVPNVFPKPKFQLGDWVRWRFVPNPDFGRIIGLIYSHEATHQVTGLHYLILLEPQSPSRSICLHDFAFEDDLERLEHPLNRPEANSHD